MSGSRSSSRAVAAPEVGPAVEPPAPTVDGSNADANADLEASPQGDQAPTLAAAGLDFSDADPETGGAPGFDFSDIDPAADAGLDFSGVDPSEDARVADAAALAAASPHLGTAPAAGAAPTRQGGTVVATANAMNGFADRPRGRNPQDANLQNDFNGTSQAEFDDALRDHAYDERVRRGEISPEDAAADRSPAGVRSLPAQVDVGLNASAANASVTRNNADRSATAIQGSVGDNGALGAGGSHTTAGGRAVSVGGTYEGSERGPSTVGGNVGGGQRLGAANVGVTVGGSMQEGWNRPVETKAGVEWTVVWVSNLSGSVGATGDRALGPGAGASVGGTVGGGRQTELKRTFSSREAAEAFYREHRDRDPDLSDREGARSVIGALGAGDELSQTESLTLGVSGGAGVSGVQATVGHTDTTRHGVKVQRTASHFDITLTTSETNTLAAGLGAVGVGASHTELWGAGSELVVRVPADQADLVAQILEAGSLQGIDRAHYTVVSSTRVAVDGDVDDTSLGLTGITETRQVTDRDTMTADGREIRDITGSNVRHADGWFENASIEHANLQGVAVDGRVVGYVLSARVDGADNLDTKQKLAELTGSRWRSAAGDDADSGRIMAVQAQLSPEQLEAVKRWLRSPAGRTVLDRGEIREGDHYITNAVKDLAKALDGATEAADELRAFADFVAAAGPQGLRWLLDTIRENGAGQASLTVSATDSAGGVDPVFPGASRAVEVEAAVNRAFLVPEEDRGAGTAAAAELDRLLQAEERAVSALASRTAYPDVPEGLQERRRLEAARHVARLVEARDELMARGFMTPRNETEVAVERTASRLRALRRDAAEALEHAAQLDRAVRSPQRGGWSGSFLEADPPSRSLIASTAHDRMQDAVLAVRRAHDAREFDLGDMAWRDVAPATQLDKLRTSLDTLALYYNALRDVYRSADDWNGPHITLGGAMPRPWPLEGRER